MADQSGGGHLAAGHTIDGIVDKEGAELLAALSSVNDLVGAEVVFVAYGSTSRIAMEAMEMLAQEGIKVGLIRPKTLWPFPVNAFKEIDFNTTKQIISVELSQGQMIYDVKLAVECKLPVSLINRVGGMLLDPQEIVDRTKKIMEVK